MFLKMLLTALLFFNLNTASRLPQPSTLSPSPSAAGTVGHAAAQNSIQVALLLDTSNSMDGLIDQAKAQLWKMVNRLADAQRQNQNATLEIALYEYGNDGLDARTGFIRQVQPMSTDLDGLSEKLFQLRTNGGNEYCGYVIKTSLDSLKWTNGADQLRIIVIAGNEPFTQGEIDYRTSCQQAVERGIIINTIHCGDYETGVNTKWQDGATIGKGKYLIIDTDKKVVHISTPYDSKVGELNERLNKTYIGYGSSGMEKKERQVAQDKNAALYSAGNATQRAVAKSKSTYRNEDWDMVDAAKADEKFVDKIKEEELPQELKGKSKAEIQAEIDRLSKERTAIRKELADLDKEIARYIAAESAKNATATETLDNVLINAVVEQAQTKGFVFPN